MFMVTGAAAASLVTHFTPPPVASAPVSRPVPARPQERAPVEDLPTYSEIPEYSAAPIPQNVARRVVKNHEKKVKQDLKDAYNTEVQCERIKAILPQIYAQLTTALDSPRISRSRTGPAAYRNEPEETGIEINFKSRGIDQKALREYLPALLADYARQVSDGEPSGANATTQLATIRSQPLSRVTTAISSTDEQGQLNSGPIGESSAQSRPSLSHANTTGSVRNYDPDRMTVKAGYFENYTQKIYFSKRFVDLWKKKNNGKREDLASGIAMILVGVKLGLPLFDLITFVALDVPRLTLQGITGKQKLKFRD